MSYSLLPLYSLKPILKWLSVRQMEQLYVEPLSVFTRPNLKDQTSLTSGRDDEAQLTLLVIVHFE